MIPLIFLFSLLLSTHAEAASLINLDVGVSASSSNSGVGVSAGASSTVAVPTTTMHMVEMKAEKVESESDLQAYASTSLRNDESLGDVSFTNNSVTVKYKERGRLLAVVPMTFNVTAIARADGSFELRYPWYSFLTLDNKDEIETDLRIAVDNAVRAHAVGSVRAEGKSEHPVLSAGERAVIAAEMQAILKARLAEKSF